MYALKLCVRCILWAVVCVCSLWVTVPCPLGDWGLRGRWPTWGAVPAPCLQPLQRLTTQSCCPMPSRQRSPPRQGSANPRYSPPHTLSPSLWLSCLSKLRSSVTLPSLVCEEVGQVRMKARPSRAAVSIESLGKVGLHSPPPPWAAVAQGTRKSWTLRPKYHLSWPPACDSRHPGPLPH